MVYLTHSSRAVGESSGAEMHERVLSAFAELLERREYDDISVVDIIRASGIGAQDFLRRFSGKAALLPALLQRIETLGAAQLGGLWKTVAPESLEGRVSLLVESHARAYRLRQRCYRACLAVNLSPQLLRSVWQLKAARDRLRRLVSWLLESSDIVEGPESETSIELAVYFCLQQLRTSTLSDDCVQTAKLRLIRFIARP